MDGGAGYAAEAAGKDGVPAYMDLDMQLDQLLRYGLSDAVGTIRILLNDQLPHVRDNAQQLVTKLLTGLSHMYGGTQSAKRQRLSEIASASAGIVTGPEIAKIQAISVNCPGVVRGKVDVVFSAEYMTIRSARVGDLSFTYDSIISVIHLPHPMPHKKQTLVIFRVSSAELPRVSEIVFQLKTTEQAAILVNPDLAKETHPKLLNVDLTLPTHNNLVEFVRLMDEEHIDVVTPTEKAIPCHLKVIDGFLYLLPNGMLFLTKILFLPLDDIAKIEISGGASRTFDIMVHLHDFGIYEFTMISRDFEQTVAQYMASIHNRVVAEGGYDQAPQLADEDVHAEGAVGMQSMPLGIQSLQPMPMPSMAMQNLPSMQNLQQMHPSMMSMLGGGMGGVGPGPVGVPLPHH